MTDVKRTKEDRDIEKYREGKLLREGREEEVRYAKDL
jgi:hypothetical protein